MISVASRIIDIQLEQNQGTAYAQQLQEQRAQAQQLLNALDTAINKPRYSENLNKALEELNGREE